MCNEKTKQSGRSLFMLAAACAFVIFSTGVVSEFAMAQEHEKKTAIQPGALAVSDLETAFWACDYAATTRGVLSTPVEICGALTEDFKRVRFGGDFAALLKWWQENKAAAHRNLAREVQPAAFGGTLN